MRDNAMIARDVALRVSVTRGSTRLTKPVSACVGFIDALFMDFTGRFRHTPIARYELVRWQR
jgi:hypothetical protein